MKVIGICGGFPGSACEAEAGFTFFGLRAAGCGLYTHRHGYVILLFFTQPLIGSL